MCVRMFSTMHLMSFLSPLVAPATVSALKSSQSYELHSSVQFTESSAWPQDAPALKHPAALTADALLAWCYHPSQPHHEIPPMPRKRTWRPAAGCHSPPRVFTREKSRLPPCQQEARVLLRSRFAPSPASAPSEPWV